MLGLEIISRPEKIDLSICSLNTSRNFNYKAKYFVPYECGYYVVYVDFVFHIWFDVFFFRHLDYVIPRHSILQIPNGRDDAKITYISKGDIGQYPEYTIYYDILDIFNRNVFDSSVTSFIENFLPSHHNYYDYQKSEGFLSRRVWYYGGITDNGNPNQDGKNGHCFGSFDFSGYGRVVDYDIVTCLRNYDFTNICKVLGCA